MGAFNCANKVICNSPVRGLQNHLQPPIIRLVKPTKKRGPKDECYRDKPKLSADRRR
jgi:hypothetical protein